VPYFSYCFKHLSLYGFPSGHFYHFPKKVSYKIQVRVFNHLPQNIKSLSSNVKSFKSALKGFLLMGSFYTPDEYFGWISMRDLGTYM
jgi:hypothetical protein